MNETIRVRLGAGGYDIHVGQGLINHAGSLLVPLAGGLVPIVTDEHVAGLHLDPFVASLRDSGLKPYPIVLPPGEGTKSFACLEKLCRELLRLDVERRGMIVAFGGGVIGDLTGLAAGLLKRGVDFAQVPTTLLAQVDSSVGGKTAIDVPEGKNLVGLFHQPKIVLADTSLVLTLSRRELLSGYAEVVKYGALGDADFFAWLEANGEDALAGDPVKLTSMVAHSCRMKSAIVARDERETGERALLNLGHTFGHALEAATGYSNRLLHGEAVAIGMVLAFRLSERLRLCTPADTNRLIRHLRTVGLPVRIADIPGAQPTLVSLLEHMRRDKKARQGRLTFILARGLGRACLSDDVPVEAVEATFGE